MEAAAQTDGVEVTLSDPSAVSPDFTPPSGGVYTFSLVVNDGTADSEPDEVVITVEQPSAPTMVVDTIIMNLVQLYGGWRTYATATVYIVDAIGPVPNVSITGHWEGATFDTESGTTDADGKITFYSNFIRRPSSGTKYTFKIDTVSKSGYEWDDTNSVLTGVVIVP
jgi:hypothetical protein